MTKNKKVNTLTKLWQRSKGIRQTLDKKITKYHNEKKIRQYSVQQQQMQRLYIKQTLHVFIIKKKPKLVKKATKYICCYRTNKIKFLPVWNGWLFLILNSWQFYALSLCPSAETLPPMPPAPPHDPVPLHLENMMFQICRKYK